MAEQSPKTDGENESSGLPTAKKKPRRLLKWTAGGFVALILALYIGAPLVARRIVRLRLQQMIASKVNAELRIGSLSYKFPFGVDVENAELVSTGPEGQSLEMLKIPKLRIELARLPFHSGPLVISRLILTEPSIHLIKPKSGATENPVPVHSKERIDTPFVATKLSEMFELRQVAVKGGQIVYEDRTRPDTVAFVWRNVNLDLGTDPTKNPVYNYNLVADNGSLASLQMAGNFNIDEFTAAIEKMKMELKVDPDDKQSPAPAEIQQILINNKISGAIMIEGTAQFAAKDASSSKADITISILNARGKLPGLGDEVQIGGGASRSVARIHLTSIALTPEQQLLATALKMRSAAAIPIYVSIDDFQARGGGNVVMMKHADAALDARAPNWQLHEAKVRVLLGSDQESTPSALMKQASLMGAVDLVVSGSGSAGAKDARAADYRLLVHAESPNLTATDQKITLTNLKSDFVLTPNVFEIVDDEKTYRGFNANVYGGVIYAKGVVQYAQPMKYSAFVKVKNVDLQQAAEALPKSGGATVKLSGRAAMNVQVDSKPGTTGQSILNQLNGRGEFEVVDGRFYELPMISQIAEALKAGADAGNVGRAAGIFVLGDQKVHMNHIALSSPLLGVDGSGDIAFNGALNLTVVAAPLGDWKKKLEGTKIPLVDDIGAQLVGGIQKLVNSATGKVLFQFKVTGTTDEPKLTTEPVPLLSAGGAKLFAHMLKGGDQLLEQLKSIEGP